jgi:hypothetical protein
VLVAVVPRPPPNCPTITTEVSGTDAGKRFFKLIDRLPGGTVITTGDQGSGVVPTAFGFKVAQVAGATAAALQL